MRLEIPDPRRPSLSGYVDAGRLLPWPWVDARMDVARNYWITSHSRGYPSSRAVWGVWQSPVLWFSTGSAIGRNIRRDARVQVNLESAEEVVIVEGSAYPLPEADAAHWARLYNEKYSWDMPESSADVWAVLPARILAWTSDSSGLDRGVMFSNSATEWLFAPS